VRAVGRVGKRVIYLHSEPEPDNEEDLEDQILELMGELNMEAKPKRIAKLNVEDKKQLIVELEMQLPGHNPLEAKSSTDIRIPVHEGKLVVLPTPETERIYVCGKSGVGKSTFAANYMHEYARMFPKRRIILFSRHEDDPVFRGVKHIAIPLDDDLMETPPELKALANALVVFDDCDNLPDKHVMDIMHTLNNDIISNGRKFNIHTLYLGHQMFNYKATRGLLNEANKVVFFLNGVKIHPDRWMKEHGGYDKDLRARILKLPTRWVCCDVGMPGHILYERGCFLA